MFLLALLTCWFYHSLEPLSLNAVPQLLTQLPPSFPEQWDLDTWLISQWIICVMCYECTFRSMDLPFGLYTIVRVLFIPRIIFELFHLHAESAHTHISCALIFSWRFSSESIVNLVCICTEVQFTQLKQLTTHFSLEICKPERHVFFRNETRPMMPELVFLHSSVLIEVTWIDSCTWLYYIYCYLYHYQQNAMWLPWQMDNEL